MEVGVNNDLICTKLSDALDSAESRMSNMLDNLGSRAAGPIDSLRHMADGWVPSNLNDKLNGIEDIVTGISDGVSLGDDWGDNPLAKCAGINVLGFDPDFLFNFPNLPFGLFPEFMDFLADAIEGLLSLVLDAAELAALAAINALKALVKASFLDEILGMILCFTGQCPDRGIGSDSSTKKFMTELDIEDKLSKHGMDIGGNVDLGKFGFDSDQVLHMDALQSGKESITKSIKGLLI